MKNRIGHTDPRLSWHGHISLECTAEYTRPWRIPFSDRALFYPGLVEKAGEPSGVRLAFLATARAFSVGILQHDLTRFLDLCVNGRFVTRQNLGGEKSVAFENLPEGEKLVELWLPQLGDFALQWIEMEKDAEVRPFEDQRKRWMTYGSSITQCRTAEAPTQTWPSIVARAQNLNLTSLGLSGQCLFDPLVAVTMRDQPADYLSLCAGINAFTSNSLNDRSFASGLTGFVRIIREKHPRTPLAIISPVYCPSGETIANAVGWTVQDYRNAVKEAVAVLTAHGDKYIYYFNGLDLFGKNLAHFMPDGLHPNAEGYKLLGYNFLDCIAPALFGTPQCRDLLADL